MIFGTILADSPFSLAHAAEAGLALPAAPILFIKPRTALAGPGDLPVSKAAQNDQLDYETELALVIGKDCRDVTEDQALDYVLGCVQGLRELYFLCCYRNDMWAD